MLIYSHNTQLTKSLNRYFFYNLEIDINVYNSNIDAILEKIRIEIKRFTDEKQPT